MSAIIRRVPTHKISKREFLTPFDRLFDDMINDLIPTFSRDFGEDFFAKGSYPKVNVINHEECVEIEAAIPGMDSDDIDVEITDSVLTIQGSSNQISGIRDDQYVKREIKKSSFKRSFSLNDNLDSEDITASFNNGILTLKIPKIVPDNAKPVTRKIKIS